MAMKPKSSQVFKLPRWQLCSGTGAVLLVDFMSQGMTVNSVANCPTLKKIWRVIQKKRYSILSKGVLVHTFRTRFRSCLNLSDTTFWTIHDTVPISLLVISTFFCIWNTVLVEALQWWWSENGHKLLADREGSRLLWRSFSKFSCKLWKNALLNKLIVQKNKQKYVVLKIIFLN